MNCVSCGHAMNTRRENYQYTASGLPHVTLVGVEVSRCPRCGETEVAIPRIEDLHRAIARTLIEQRARLIAPEIRFLRKHLGWSGVDFAAHMGATPETVSRWEKGAVPLGAASDRLLRLMVASKTPGRDYSLATLKDIDEARRTKPVPVGFRVRRDGWRAAAA